MSVLWDTEPPERQWEPSREPDYEREDWEDHVEAREQEERDRQYDHGDDR